MSLAEPPAVESFRNPLLAHDRARELAKLYWHPFIVVPVTGKTGRYCIKLFVPPPGHDPRTQVYTTRAGIRKEICYPPEEPSGSWKARVMAEKSIEIDVTVKRITDKAYLVELENPMRNNKTEETWIPKSQVIDTDCLAEGDEGVMEITSWIAKQKDLMEDED